MDWLEVWTLATFVVAALIYCLLIIAPIGPVSRRRSDGPSADDRPPTRPTPSVEGDRPA